MNVRSTRSHSFAMPETLMFLLRGFCQSSSCKLLKIGWTAERTAWDNLISDY